MALALSIAVGINHQNAVLRNTDRLTNCQPSLCRKLGEQGSIHCVLNDAKIGKVGILCIDILPVIREEIDTLGILVHRLNQRRGDTLVDLIHIKPQLVGSDTLLIFHRLNEPVNNQGIIVDHHYVRIDHIKILVDLVESKSLLLRILICGRVICHNTLRNRTKILARRVALKSEMIRPHIGSELRKLSKQIIHHLRIPGRLIHMSANKNEPHL